MQRDERTVAGFFTRTSYCRRTIRRRSFGSSVSRECSPLFAALAVDDDRYTRWSSRPCCGDRCGVRCAYVHCRTLTSDLQYGGSTPSLQ